MWTFPLQFNYLRKTYYIYFYDCGSMVYFNIYLHFTMCICVFVCFQGQFFISEKCLLYKEGMIKLENHHFPKLNEIFRLANVVKVC